MNRLEKWSMDYIIHIVKSINCELYFEVVRYFGKIFFLKLLEKANNQNIHFELIKKVIHIVLLSSLKKIKDNIFGESGFIQWNKETCSFFKEFVKKGKKNTRYYNLIYEILTNQAARNKVFLLGNHYNRSTEWCKEFFDKLL